MRCCCNGLSGFVRRIPEYGWRELYLCHGSYGRRSQPRDTTSHASLQLPGIYRAWRSKQANYLRNDSRRMDTYVCFVKIADSIWHTGLFSRCWVYNPVIVGSSLLIALFVMTLNRLLIHIYFIPQIRSNWRCAHVKVLYLSNSPQLAPVNTVWLNYGPNRSLGQVTV